MSDSPKIERAIAVSRHQGDSASLTLLAELLGNANITLAVCTSGEEASAAILVAADDQLADCVLVDGSTGSFNSDDLEHLRATVPQIAPLVFSEAPTAQVVLDAFRAGAHDFIDLADSSEAAILSALEGSAIESRLRAERRSQLSEMRKMVEEFLRVLVRTERRSIDLEDQLRIAHGEPLSDDDSEEELRPPTVLVVDDDDDIVDLLMDTLTREGLKVVSAERGEEAIAEVRRGIEWKEPIDLVIVDKNLPDINGLETIRRIRKMTPSPPAIVMTGYASQESAIDAADLGVIGYVLKPFDDIRGLVKRITDAASRAGSDRRERKYLERIKDRHAEFLLRYRKLAAQLGKL